MFQFATGDDVISAGKATVAEFQQILKEFNAIKESEGDGYVKGKDKTPPSGDKINKLQGALDKWFGGTIDIRDLSNSAYDLKLAANNRNNFLCANGKPLNQKDYPGTILPTNCQ